MLDSVGASLSAGLEDARESLTTVTAGARARDLVVVGLVVPAVLLGVEGAIRSQFWVCAAVTRDALRFPLTVESFWTPAVLGRAFVSSYAHDSFVPHLAGNLTMYLLTMSALYPLSILGARTRAVRVTIGACLLVVPYVVAYQSLRHPLGQTSIGFSGVVVALLGALPIVLFPAVTERTEFEIRPHWSGGPMLVILAGVGAVTGSPSTVVWVVGGLGGALCLLGVVRFGGRGVVARLYPMIQPGNPFCWWGSTVAVAGPNVLFFSVAPRTNLVGHLAGYVSGYLIALLVINQQQLP